MIPDDVIVSSDGKTLYVNVAYGSSNDNPDALADFGDLIAFSTQIEKEIGARFLQQSGPRPGAAASRRSRRSWLRASASAAPLMIAHCRSPFYNPFQLFCA